MKAIGLIAEYNPFHNGHLYHLNKMKEMDEDAAIVLVMSGNFTERGEVSIMDKWKRTEIALNHGVDLVVELPYPFATQSADFFSYGGVTLLEKLKVDSLVFGSESNDIDTLELIAKTQVEEADFDKLVKIYSKMGKNYPTALSCALEDLTGKKITTPNDLLGVSYIKTILENNYKIKPITIQRTNDYHSESLEESISSATSIREALKEGKKIENQVPKDTLKYYENLHFMEDYFELLKYKILTEDHLEKYQTVEEGIEGALKKEIENATSYEDFIKRIKSKRYTYNKISRMLLHILCGFTKEKAKEMKNISYIRILGFTKKGRDYLNQVKKEVDVPIISKITREKDPMLEFEMNTTKIYDIKTNNCKKKEEGKIIIGGEND